MAKQLFANNAVSVLAVAASDVATTLTVISGDGALFPSPTGGDWFSLTLTQASDETSWEMVKVTARTGDVLTVTRAQEGSVAAAWGIGAKAEARLTAAAIALPVEVATNNATAKATPVDADEIPLADSAATYALKHLTWANLKATLKSYFDSAAQTLTNKTIDLGSNTLSGTLAQFNTAVSDGDFAAVATLAAAGGAATVGNTPAGNIAATTVQAAINELDESVASSARFIKADPTTVAFTKLTAGTAEIKAGTVVDVDGITISFATATAITMPALTAGTDYAIYACADGTLRADASFSAPSGYTTANSRKIGGFHYAPGGNATAMAGGNTTPQINEYSFWDLKFKPNCPDPRGMALVAGGFWVDIYLTGVDAITNGTSKYNVAIADGASPPKIPSLFGGNGTTTYGTLTWFEAMELATAFGKRCLSQQEFMAAMYGTTEATQSGGTDVPTTGVTGTGATSAWNVFTSKWGVVQATGCMWIWGLDRGGPYGAAAWNANTEGRGSEYNAPNAVLLGGRWGAGASCGSRCSLWDAVASFSGGSVGSRFSCDHLTLE
jgi:hypothetical protein